MDSESTPRDASRSNGVSEPTLPLEPSPPSVSPGSGPETRALIVNRRGVAINWRRLEELRPGVPPPEFLAIGSRGFARWDLHPQCPQPEECARRFLEQGVWVYAEVSYLWLSSFSE